MIEYVRERHGQRLVSPSSPLCTQLQYQNTMSWNVQLQEWPYHVGWEGEALEREEQSQLTSIPEEEAGSSTEQGDAAACLLFLLGLEITDSAFLASLPIGATWHHVRQLGHSHLDVQC